MRVFIDTSAFLALVDSKDQFHGRAKKLNQYHGMEHQWHTSNLVLYETYTLIRYRINHRTMMHFIDAFDQQHIDVIGIDTELEQLALDKLRKYSDQEFSFTDCASFAVMASLKIQTVFGFDRDFERAGFTLLGS